MLFTEGGWWRMIVITGPLDIQNLAKNRAQREECWKINQRSFLCNASKSNIYLTQIPLTMLALIN